MLKLELKIVDEQDQSLGPHALLVSYGALPTLLHGETRLVRTTVSVPRSPEKYRLWVVEAEAL